MPVDVKPIGEEMGNVVVARQRAREPVAGHLHRFVAAAMGETEEDEEGAAEHPEPQGNRQPSQQATLDSTAV